MADDALELSFDDASEEAVIDCWQRLAFCGIPSQADHARGMTNAPHVSVAVASCLPAAARVIGRAEVVPLLPARLSVQGVIVLGKGSRVSLALLLEPDAELVRAVRSVRSAVPLLRHPLWLPHVTLARRVPRHRLGEALAEIGSGPDAVVANRLRWWDAAAGTVETLTEPAA